MRLFLEGHNHKLGYAVAVEHGETVRYYKKHPRKVRAIIDRFNRMLTNRVMKKPIEHDGDTWKIIGIGTVNPESNKVYCHLASTTRGRHQKNGFIPIQSGRWIDIEKLKAKP